MDMRLCNGRRLNVGGDMRGGVDWRTWVDVSGVPKVSGGHEVS